MSIYKLTSSSTNKEYVGRTKQTLPTRFSKHKYNYKQYLDGKYGDCQAKHILKYGDAKIKLLEKCKKGANVGDRERWWIKNTKHSVNKKGKKNNQQ
jgi:hypothetical protein